MAATRSRTERASKARASGPASPVKSKVVPAPQALNLRRLREEVGSTQVEAAERAAMTQGELSRLENAADLRLSTIRKYVHAMGGDLELFAVVNGKRIPLHRL
jgi:predicted transcriptional regulator